MSEDMELSCDESVLRQMGNKIKKDYAQSLLNLSANAKFVGRSPVAFGENKTKGRIKNIMIYKKPTFGIILVSIIAVFAAAIVLMSNLKNDKNQLDNEDKSSSSSSESIEINTVVSSTSDETKSIKFELANKTQTLSVDFPNYIAKYITLQSESMSFEESSIFFCFTKGEQTANIGGFEIYTKKQFDEALKAESEPNTPSKDDIIVTFIGIQSPPFDSTTEEGKLVDKYYSEKEDIIKTMKLR